jgi:hypothetical protein
MKYTGATSISAQHTPATDFIQSKSMGDFLHDL